ncbi:hypothetical protein F5888DRAFT_1139544 [Russula emetica]|nr:hypothetical protein F5888DRAFT_1139544 [Russula emetica]
MPRSQDVEAQAPRPVRNSGRRKLRRPGSNYRCQDTVAEKNPHRPKYAPKHGDTSATYWNLYGSEAEINDKNLVDSLMDNTSSMVLLNTLFSSIIASFIIEIYKTLLPSNSQQTADSPPSSAVRFNIVLFLSFFLSLMSAVACAFIQQWCYEYKKFAYPRTAPHERGRVRTYLFQGLEEFHMTKFMYGTHVLLHTSVFLFFWAISDFFYTVHHQFGTVTRYILVASVIVYMILSISPLIFGNSPYNTPMTLLLRAACIILRIIIRFPSGCLRRIRGQPFKLIGLEYYKGIRFDKVLFLSLEAEKRAEVIEPYAMEWLFTKNDFSDNDMDKFLEGLPGYMYSDHTKKDQLDEYLTSNYILRRIKEHYITCVTTVELSDEASIARVSACVTALRLIFQYSRKCKEKSSIPGKLEEELHSQRKYDQELMDDFQFFCGIGDPMIALRASCIRGLAVQSLLSQLVPPDTGTTESPQFPLSLIPFYKFCFPDDSTNTIQQLVDGHTPSAMEITRMWNNFLHDGPLANLTALAQAVRRGEHAAPSTLSFCWKVLDILLMQLATIQSEEPTPAQSHFDDLHGNVRAYVQAAEWGFRITPLLNILDAVARGRRLLMVFSGHPKYHSRADVVFGKDYLRNGDFLEAFAHCLPDFIANHSPEVCRDLMEKVVRDDELWTSLQVNLWNTQRSERPTPDKLRAFEDCCTVLDLAFSVLEDSREVDWRAPEFGSLSQHVESFITHCFQGAFFMGRAASFRVGIIKARFCKALLAQFKDDIDREGTVSFRSQWDIASLARLICFLGFRDKEDAVFWDSYVNRGHIGEKFTAKALEMIDIAARDGPLLIFCQLGHLAVSAVPLNQSGLKPKEMENVLKLQMKVIENKRLPLRRASAIVWEVLGQLRELVNTLCVKNTGKDRKQLKRLLRMIDKVSHIRSSGSESMDSDSGQSEPAENRRSFGSGSTAVNGGPSSDTQTSESEDGFGHSGSESSDSLPSFHSTVQVTPGRHWQ